MPQTFFSLALYQPVLNFVIFLARLCSDNLGIAVIIFTVLFRLLLWPFFEKSEKVQKQLAIIQPELQKIQKESKGNQEEMTKAMMGLYKKYNISPTITLFVFAFSIFQIVAMFIFFSLFRNLVDPAQLASVTTLFYPFLKGVVLNYSLLGLNLASHSLILAVAYAVVQLVQMKFMLKKQKAQGTANPMTNQMSMIMMYFLPLVILAMYRNIYAIIYLYWVVFSLVSLLQDWLASRTNSKVVSKLS